AAKYRSVPHERIILRLHIAPDPIGAMALSSITKADVAAFWRRLVARPVTVPYQNRERGRPGEDPGRTLSHKRICCILTLLRACFQQAMAAGFIDSNPAAGITIPRPLEATTDLELAGVLEADEERALLTELLRRVGEEPDRWRTVYAMVRFALGA